MNNKQPENMITYLDAILRTAVAEAEEAGKRFSPDNLQSQYIYGYGFLSAKIKEAVEAIDYYKS